MQPKNQVFRSFLFTTSRNHYSSFGSGLDSEHFSRHSYKLSSLSRLYISADIYKKCPSLKKKKQHERWTKSSSQATVIDKRIVSTQDERAIEHTRVLPLHISCGSVVPSRRPNNNGAYTRLKAWLVGFPSAAEPCTRTDIY